VCENVLHEEMRELQSRNPILKIILGWLSEKEKPEWKNIKLKPYC